MAERRPPAVRKQDIVDAAARLFGERGYAAVGMDEIGAALDVSGPSLYWHFPGKQALLAAVVVSAAERFAAGLAALAAERPEPTFAEVLAAETAFVLDTPGYARTLLTEAGRLTGDDHERVAAAERSNMAIAGGALLRLNPALDAEAAGVRLFAQLGVIAAVPGAPGSVSRSRRAALATRAVLALAAAPPRPLGPPRAPPGWEPAWPRPEAIVRAARALFRERGYDEVSMHDIGAAAGLSRPTLYRYYRSKAEILAEAWQREGMRFVVGAREALESATSAADAVARLAGAYVRVALDALDLIDLLFRQQVLEGADASPAHLRQALRDAWAPAVAEARPDVTGPERALLVDMALGVGSHGALIVGGRREWHPELVSLVTAAALGT